MVTPSFKYGSFYIAQGCRLTVTVRENPPCRRASLWAATGTLRVNDVKRKRESKGSSPF